MTFIVSAIGIPAAIGIAGAVGGAVIASSGAKSAAKTAAAGSDREIEFARESRDLVRADEAEYLAGGKLAFSALLDMTGLSSMGGGVMGNRPAGRGLGGRGGRFDEAPRRLGPAGGGRGGGGRFGSAYQGRMGGGHIYGREGGGVLYNVNELGPEDVYSNGTVTRSSNPITIPPDPTGYVGRAHGGPIGMAGPQRFEGPQQKTGAADFIPSNTPNFPKNGVMGNVPIQGGATIDNATGAIDSNLAAENPGGVEGGYSFKADPGYNFRLDEGSRVIERSAAARGGLLSGGTGRALTRYAQDYASNEYTNVYNRISNIAGLGQVANQASGNAALYAGGVMGNAASQGALSSAYGQQAGTNAWMNAATQIGNMPWGKVFNRDKSAAEGTRSGVG